MVKLVVQDVSGLRSIVGILNDILKEAKFKITNDGVQVAATDPAKIIMVMLDILPTSFDEFRCEKEVELGISIEEFYNVLRRANKGETVQIENIENTLKITTIGKVTREFMLPLIESIEDTPKIPLATFSAKIVAEADSVATAIDDASIISDELVFKAAPESFEIAAKSEFHSTKLNLNKDKLIGLDVKEPAQSAFSIDYLRRIFATSKIAPVAEINISANHIGKFSFAVVDKFRMYFLLAPRTMD